MLNRLYRINSTSLIHAVHKEKKKSHISTRWNLEKEVRGSIVGTSKVTTKGMEGIRNMAMPFRVLMLPVEEV